MGLVDDFLNSNHGRIIISIIWGLGLATLFRKACKGRNCIVIKGPNPKELKDKVYSFDGKCFKFNSYMTSCKNKKK
jgi:hypothetical protein